MNHFDIIIVGAGPAGLIASIQASALNKKVVLLEKNSSLGKKLLLTGKGRCNFTTNRSIPEIIEAFGPQGKFLYGSLARFSNQDLIDFFASRGVASKVERGDRVFPVSDQSQTILNCLIQETRKNRVQLMTNFPVQQIKKTGQKFQVYGPQNQVLTAAKVILATGGKSYPQTGSTGDGYKLAQKLGHQILPLKPALVSLISPDPDLPQLAGLSLKNVRLKFWSQDKLIFNIFGEMLFTHQGISGPIVLTASKTVFDYLNQKVTAQIDFKPALDPQTLKKRIYREIETAPKKEYQSLLKQLLPNSLIPVFIKKTQIPKDKKNASLTPEEIQKIITGLKNFSFPISKTSPLATAIVTSGGIPISEINSQTMASKISPNLYFAGEIIGLDGPTGGYNLQKAFSTGFVAGQSAGLK